MEDSLGGPGRLWRWMALAGTVALLTAGCDTGGPSRLTIENRTTRDVALRWGYAFSSTVIIPACGRTILEPEKDSAASVDAAPPAGAVELRYQFPLLPDAPTIRTLTITSEQVWTGAIDPLPPCEGEPPSSQP